MKHYKLAAGSHLEREEERVAEEGGALFYLYFVWLRRRADRSVCSVQLAEGDYNLRRITITAIRHGGRVTTIIHTTAEAQESGHCTLETVVSARTVTPSFLSVACLAPSFLNCPNSDYGRNIGLQYKDAQRRVASGFIHSLKE